MATNRTQSILSEIRSLSRDEQLAILIEIQKDLRRSVGNGKRSLLELQGLGKEIWEGIDVREYLRQERESWDG